MNQSELYPELVDYIYFYCNEFRTTDEQLASRTINWNTENMDERVRRLILAKGWFSDSENIKK